MLDIPDMPIRAFRRKLGSLAPATLEGGGNPIEDILGGVGDLVGDVVDGVSDALAGVDDFVNDVIPGGWITVGAAALLAYGIYDPEVLAAAEEGTLTSETLANAGYDAVNVARDISTLSPEVVSTTQAAISSGVSPELIAMANATADPIAALNAAAGWTVSDAAYLASIGYTGMVVNPVTGAAVDMPTALADQTAQSQGWASAAEQTTANNAGFNNINEYAEATSKGFTNATDYAQATEGGFTNAGEYNNATSRGFTNAGEWQDSIRTSFPDQASYQKAMEGGFQNNWEFQTASEGGFTNRAEWMDAGEKGISNAADYANYTAQAPVVPVTPTVDPAIQSYLDQGYTQAQIDAAIEANPNGGWGRSLSWGEMGPPGAEIPGATIDVSNMTQEQLNQALSQNNPYLETGPGGQFASAETPFRVDVSGAAGTAEAPSYAITESMTPGSQLATQAQIDAGAATWNPTANAWEVAGTGAELAPVVPAEIGGGLGAGGSTYGVGGINYVAPVVADTAAATVAAAGLTATQVAALGGTVAAAAAVTSMGASGAAQAANATIASTAPSTPVTTPPATTPVAPTPVAPPPTTTPPVEYTGPGIGEGVSPVAPVAPPVATPPPEYTGPGIGETPNPAEVPVTDLSRPAEPMGPSKYDWVAPAAIGAGVGAVAGGALGGGGATRAGYGPLNNQYPIGTSTQLVNPGLNPGWITAQPFYNTTSPVQSQYYWGAHPYTETMADLPNRNAVPYAPVIPWGVQQSRAPLDVNALIQSIINPQAQAAAVGAAPGSYAPYGTGGSV
jgi:hypothetical protein